MDDLLAYLKDPPCGGNYYYGSHHGRNQMIRAATTIEALQAQVAAKDAEIGRLQEAQKAVAEINRFACICIADSAQGINPHWLASEAKVIGAHLRAALGQGEG